MARFDVIQLESDCLDLTYFNPKLNVWFMCIINVQTVLTCIRPLYALFHQCAPLNLDANLVRLPVYQTGHGRRYPIKSRIFWLRKCPSSDLFIT